MVSLVFNTWPHPVRTRSSSLFARWNVMKLNLDHICGNELDSTFAHLNREDLKMLIRHTSNNKSCWDLRSKQRLWGKICSPSECVELSKVASSLYCAGRACNSTRKNFMTYTNVHNFCTRKKIEQIREVLIKSSFTTNFVCLYLIYKCHTHRQDRLALPALDLAQVMVQFAILCDLSEKGVLHLRVTGNGCRISCPKYIIYTCLPRRELDRAFGLRQSVLVKRRKEGTQQQVENKK